MNVMTPRVRMQLGLWVVLLIVFSPLSHARTTTNTYNALGLIETIDGPRTDVSDVTTFTYNAAGDLIQTTNALGHQTDITSHDAHGRPQTIEDPNGTVTTLTYDARGRLLTRTVDTQTTTFEYDGVGQVIQTTLPNGAFLINEYDGAQRLIAVEDNLGNRIEYTLDDMGNHLQEDVKDPLGTLTRTLSRTYNSLNRLVEMVGGANQTMTYSYDDNGNQTNIIVDPSGLNQATVQVFDSLNRLESTTDAENGITSYTYDARDNLTSVTDPNGLTTTYTYNGLNDLITQTSPDTGTTTYTYDDAGNRLTQTDARNITTTYTYDALNRLLTITYPEVSPGMPNPQNVTYTYDSCTNGIGRLCNMQDESGTTAYSYDARGNLIAETTTRGLVIMTTSYAYNGTDQLIQITYPSGRTVDYTRNVLGQIDSVSTTQDSMTETLASNLTYQPFGPMDSMTYGNSLARTNSYDLDYRLTGLTTPAVLERGYTYDAANNITAISNVIDNNRSQSFDYDQLNRLTDATGIYGDYDYTYDANGNRLTEVIDTHVQTYTYDTNSHHLLQTVNGGTTDYTYDANGNTTNNTDHDFIYGDNNRLKEAQILSTPVATYVYNGKGERVKKEGTDTTLYYYDQSGMLLAELDDTGNTQREYIYLDGVPLAMVSAASTPNPDPEEQILDNDTASFAGDWPVSTSVSGFEGANYQHHYANGPSPEGIVIDNTDTGFSVTGVWTASTSVSGFEGSNYQHHYANGPSPDAIVVDNEDAGFSTVGTWNTSTSVSGYLNTNYQANAAGTGADIATWSFTVPTAGDYQVYARWTQHSNRASNAKYTINHTGGSTVVTVNQKQNGSVDNLLGTFTFAAGNTTITLSDDADGYVIADAVQLVPPNAAPNTATWTFTATDTGSFNVYARWTQHPNRATNANYTITHDGGSDTATVNQQQNGGQYNLLGTYPFTQGNSYSVSLTDEANGYVIADAIQLTPPNAGPNTVTWNPQLTQEAEYEIQAKWTSHPNRATNATYIITHANGMDTVTVSQQTNGGIFNSLGTYTLDQNSTIQLTDEANGYVIADAIKITQTSTPPPATQTGIFFFHTDHLGTPQVMTDNMQQVVWNADYEPFGQTTITTETVVNNFRFPGQLYDQETGLHYNYFRDYDPSTGRYIQSDPIGLDGGLNTYTYAFNSPIMFFDLNGASPATKLLVPPGLCSDGQHASLQAEVERACKRKRKCTGDQDCIELNMNLRKNIECAEARERINSVCFLGGNLGHRFAAVAAWLAAGKCGKFLQQKGCPGQCF